MLAYSIYTDRIWRLFEFNGHSHRTYLTTEYGKPGFGNWVRDRCDEAGLHHCSAHGLREAGRILSLQASGAGGA
jgi:hypothetical protein